MTHIAITRTIWKNSFTKENIPNWVCPICKKENLISGKEDVKIFKSTDSIKNQKHPDLDPEWVRGIFSLVLKCDNQNCKESVLVIGKMNVETEFEYEYDSQFGVMAPSHNEKLQPTLFMPAVNIRVILI